MGDKTKGLLPKYNVTRTDGKPVGFCFVLEDKDPLTPVVLRAYATAAGAAGYHQLAADLQDKATSIEAEQGRQAWIRETGIEDPDAQRRWHCQNCNHEVVGRVCDACGEPEAWQASQREAT